jgi:hypothetical protein
VRIEQHSRLLSIGPRTNADVQLRIKHKQASKKTVGIVSPKKCIAFASTQRKSCNMWLRLTPFIPQLIFL